MPNWFSSVRQNQIIAGPLASFLRLIAGTARDIAPIVIVIAFFQLAVLQQPFPNLEKIIVGLLFVMVGLALFIKGLEMLVRASSKLTVAPAPASSAAVR